jgi:hypothetical protein
MRSIGYGAKLARWGQGVNECASASAAGPLPTLPRKRGRKIMMDANHRAATFGIAATLSTTLCR